MFLSFFLGTVRTHKAKIVITKFSGGMQREAILKIYMPIDKLETKLEIVCRLQSKGVS